MRRRPLAEMAAWRPDQTVLTDLSANIFAALLLMLLMLMQFGMPHADSGAEAPSSLRPLPRRALDAGRLVALLHDRGTPEGVSLDLGDTTLAAAPGASQPLQEGLRDLETLLASPAGGGTVRLYVFGNRGYGAVTALLSRLGRSWTEISVPRALRDPDAPDRWSPAFLRLLTTRDAAAFRDGLATLLAQAPAVRPDGVVSAQEGAAAATSPVASAPPAFTLLDTLQRWLRGVGLVLLALAAALPILLIEMLVPHRRLR